MDFQILIVALIIAAACFYVGRLALKKIKSVGKKSSCEIDCGCGAKSKKPVPQTGRN